MSPILDPAPPGSDVEALALDGLSLNNPAGALGLSALSAPPPKERPEWIASADSESAGLVRQPLHENRIVTCTLSIAPQVTMDLALDQIAAVVDKLRKASKTTDGIPLVWSPAGSVRSVTFDVLDGEITDMPISWEDGWMVQAPTLTVELTCKPYWRGTEVTTSTASASAPFVTLEVANVPGDVPALGRLIVTDTATQNRRHVEWGLEGQYYNSATSLLLDSDSLVTSGFGGSQTTASGAYDPNATGPSAIAITAALQNLPAAMCGTGTLTHVGTFRVKARAQLPSQGAMRLTWQAADGPLTSNDWMTPAGNGRWEELDLGTITIPPVLTGAQQWSGRVDVLSTIAGGTVTLDYLELIPAGEGYGKARAAYSPQAGVLVGVDSFTGTTTGSALNGRTAPTGGTWATSGDATDLTFFDTANDEGVVRTTASDTAGRYAILGSSTYTDIQAQARVNVIGVRPDNGLVTHSVIARWTDSSNFLRLVLTSNSRYTYSQLAIIQTAAGAATTLATTPLTATVAPGIVFKLNLVAYASGRAVGTLLTDAGAQVAQIEASSTALATGGALATGQVGMHDKSVSSSAVVRYYDDFMAVTPPAEPLVIYSGRNIEIRHDTVIRQNAAGTVIGRPQSYRGSRFLLPVGTSRVLVKARRNDIETAADDTVTDATQVQVAYTPRGLAVPR